MAGGLQWLQLVLWTFLLQSSLKKRGLRESCRSCLQIIYEETSSICVKVDLVDTVIYHPDPPSMQDLRPQLLAEMLAFSCQPSQGLPQLQGVTLLKVTALPRIPIQ